VSHDAELDIVPEHGTWLHRGDNYVTIALISGESFEGVLSRQWNTNARSFVVHRPRFHGTPPAARVAISSGLSAFS
jgi:hypothetical protein